MTAKKIAQANNVSATQGYLINTGSELHMYSMFKDHGQVWKSVVNLKRYLNDTVKHNHCPKLLSCKGGGTTSQSLPAV